MPASRSHIEFSDDLHLEAHVITRELHFILFPDHVPKAVQKSSGDLHIHHVQLTETHILVDGSYLDDKTRTYTPFSIPVDRAYFFDKTKEIRDRIERTIEQLKPEELAELLCEEGIPIPERVTQITKFLIKRVFTSYGQEGTLPTPAETTFLINHFLQVLAQVTTHQEPGKTDPETIKIFAETRYWVEMVQSLHGILLGPIVDAYAIGVTRDNPGTAWWRVEEKGHEVGEAERAMKPTLNNLPPAASHEAKIFARYWPETQKNELVETVSNLATAQGCMEAVINEYAALCFELDVNEIRLRRSSGEDESDKLEDNTLLQIYLQLIQKYEHLLDRHRATYTERGIIPKGVTSIVKGIIEHFMNNDEDECYNAQA